MLFLPFMAWCQLRSASKDEVTLDGRYYCEKEGQIKQSPRQLHHLGLKSCFADAIFGLLTEADKERGYPGA